MLPWLSRLSVSVGPATRLRLRCSSQYQRISPLHWEFRLPLPHSSPAVSEDPPGLSPGLSLPTCRAAYAPFTPSNSEQRLPPTYYRGCWHVVSRGLYQVPSSRAAIHHSDFFPDFRSLHPRGISSSTRRCWVRLSPIAQNSPLLPPVGVWPVSQCQCGGSSSQTRYRS